MKKRLASILAVLIMAFVMIPLSFNSNSEASAEPVVSCKQVRISPQQVRVECSAAGIIVLNTVLDLPTAPPVTITVQLPGSTETISVPGPTKTVTVPGDTETVTTGGPTKTVTVSPQPNSPSALPSQNQPAQPSAGQTVTQSVTVEAEPSAPSSDPLISIPGVPDIVEKAAIGILSVILLVGLLLLGMFLGYYLGFRDSDSANARFMGALRDELFVRKK